jgi:hypothetical protein
MKLLNLRGIKLVGASGFKPPTSWSRTGLDQTKSVELTAFALCIPSAYLGYVGYKTSMAYVLCPPWFARCPVPAHCHGRPGFFLRLTPHSKRATEGLMQ